jgi:hypothetical protein
MKRELFYILLLLLSAAAGWLLPGIVVGATIVWQVGGALTAIFLIAAVIAARRAPGNRRVAAGLLMIGLLFFPTTLYLADLPGGATAPFGPPMSFTVVALLAVAIVVAALLLHGAAVSRSLDPSIGQADDGRIALLPLMVACLLLAIILHTLYWLMVWDSTYDPIGTILLMILVLITVIVGAVLVMAMSGRARRVGILFLLLVPLGLVLVTVLAQRSDFRRITISRAERAGRALEAYHAREGDYPATLQQLIPRDALYLAGPVIIFGQGWCYDTDGASYRLGYVDRDHWSAPRLIGRVHKSAANSTESKPICANEIDRLINQYPDFFERQLD